MCSYFFLDCVDETLGYYIPNKVKFENYEQSGNQAVSNMPDALVSAPLIYLSAFQDLMNVGRFLWSSLT